MAKNFFVDRRFSPNGRSSAINMDNAENLLPYVLGIFNEEITKRGLVNDYGYFEVSFEDSEETLVGESTLNVYQLPENITSNTILMTPYVGEGSADYYVYLPTPESYDGRIITFIRKDAEGDSGSIFVDTNTQTYTYGSNVWNFSYKGDRIQLLALDGSWYLINEYFD